MGGSSGLMGGTGSGMGGGGGMGMVGTPRNFYGGYGGGGGGGGNGGGYASSMGYSYAGYIERQARRYPIMMYTLVQCVPCQRAKHLLAVSYNDVAAHFLGKLSSQF